MRFLARNAIFIFFVFVVVAVVFLAWLSLRAALRFGDWGGRSIAESTLLLANEKIDRIEQLIIQAEHAYFRIVDPAAQELACERWRRMAAHSRLIEAAAIVNDDGDIVNFYHRATTPKKESALRSFFEKEVVPRVDKYESLDQYKHLHLPLDKQYRLITHLTTQFEDRDYTAILLYDTSAIIDGLLARNLGNMESGLIVNVIDQYNQIIYGRRIDGVDEFIVARRFPGTLYKWWLQLAPTSASYLKSQAEAQRFSESMLAPLAVGVILLGLVVLGIAVLRERRLNRLKSDFVANVSHELKTPLSLIRMFAELLSMDKVGDEARTKRYYEIILRETDRLTALIENVLNLAKIERGKGEYNFEPKDLREIVERGVEICKHRLETAGIALEQHFESELPLARVDEHSIFLAVVNLVDNAAKYAKGTAAVRIELAKENGFIRVEVSDRGVGIPAQHLRRIFDRFYRVPSDETRRHRGSGIGLSLVKHIAEAHGGSVTATSEPCKETRFTIRIPVAGEEHTT